MSAVCKTHFSAQPHSGSGIRPRTPSSNAFYLRVVTEISRLGAIISSLRHSCVLEVFFPVCTLSSEAACRELKQMWVQEVHIPHRSLTLFWTLPHKHCLKKVRRAEKDAKVIPGWLNLWINGELCKWQGTGNTPLNWLTGQKPKIKIKEGEQVNPMRLLKGN